MASPAKADSPSPLGVVHFTVEIPSTNHIALSGHCIGQHRPFHCNNKIIGRNLWILADNGLFVKAIYVEIVFMYEKVSDVPESRVWFASKKSDAL